LASVAGRTPAIQTGAHADKHRDHVLHQVILEFARIDDEQLAAVGGEGRLDVLAPKRISLSRCSTTIVRTFGSLKSA